MVVDSGLGLVFDFGFQLCGGVQWCQQFGFGLFVDVVVWLVEDVGVFVGIGSLLEFVGWVDWVFDDDFDV